ncbi:agmatinase [Klebsiella pneumoniae]|uniref:Agmatinase n=1 Tax=Klebsiella pneumoniae TaxID=573 RepID=A0A2X3ERN2_KLEPN|nr:agmatinase [Klebsiella pneumoniae]
MPLAFCGLPMNFMPYESDADWVITGVPFDMATSGRAGGRHGPAAIRQVSITLPGSTTVSRGTSICASA